MAHDKSQSSLSLAYAMRKKARKGGKVKRDENVKGVHQTNYEDPGQSMAGMYVRAAKEGAPNKEELISNAKKEHETILREIREMQKPKLYAKGGEACSGAGCPGCPSCVDSYAKGGAVGDLKNAYHALERHRKHQERKYGEPARTADKFPGQSAQDRAKSDKLSKNRANATADKGVTEKDVEDVIDSYPKKKKMAHGGDVVTRAMQKYSQGGKVANKTTMAADMKPNQFDDLVLNDDLDFEYTGANSGDELGNAREDHDRKDIVARIMKSRAKKDRMPRPA